MPPLRTVGTRLLPLRSPQVLPPGVNMVQEHRFNLSFTSLLSHHQFHNPQEQYLKPEIKDIRGTVQAGYDFFGEFIAAAKITQIPFQGFVGNLTELKHKPVSEVAALLLEDVFGRATTSDEMFVVPWAMTENASLGNVYWDVENDRIIAKTPLRFTIAIEGSNLVEAAVYLPRMYAALQKHGIPEEIGLVEVRVEGEREEWSQAASPLHIKCWVPNLGSIHYSEINQLIQSTIAKSMNNRIIN